MDLPLRGWILQEAKGRAKTGRDTVSRPLSLPATAAAGAASALRNRPIL